jgi:hypothetical protein
MEIRHWIKRADFYRAESGLASSCSVYPGLQQVDRSYPINRFRNGRIIDLYKVDVHTPA